MMSSVSSIALENIHKRYHPGWFSLHIDNLTFSRDNTYCIVGPNGSGKSSILKLIALLIKPDEGNILFNGIFSNNNQRGRLLRKIGFVMQKPYLFNTTVFENVALGLKIRSYPRNEIISKVTNILETLKIRHLAEQKPRFLSGGEYQKAAIAQILVLEPQVILLDEPAANVDSQSVLSIEETVKLIQKKTKSIVIMTTHSLTQAYRMSPDIISIREGRIVDFVHENVFFGQIKEVAGGLQGMQICAGIEIVFSTKRRGKSYIAIDPEDIIISKEAVRTSARNTFSGSIIKMESLGPNIRLLIDVGVPIYSVITKQSFKEMDINLGMPVCVSFKVNSVEVI